MSLDLKRGRKVMFLISEEDGGRAAESPSLRSIEVNQQISNSSSCRKGSRVGQKDDLDV